MSFLVGGRMFSLQKKMKEKEKGKEDSRSGQKSIQESGDGVGL